MASWRERGGFAKQIEKGQAKQMVQVKVQNEEEGIWGTVNDLVELD